MLSPVIQSEIQQCALDVLPRECIADGSYWCVYGSAAYAPDHRPTSDIDLFFATPHPLDVSTKAALVDRVIDLHQRLGRLVDEEVPYDNKIAYTFGDIAAAASLRCFQANDGTFRVEPVIKAPTFLGGQNIRDRLVLNALTTPNIAMGGLHSHRIHRRLAANAMTIVGAYLLGGTFNEVDVYASLTTGPRGEEGEIFLGYKTEHPVVAWGLRRMIDAGISTLVDTGVIETGKDGYTFDTTLPPVEVMQRTRVDLERSPTYV